MLEQKPHMKPPFSICGNIPPLWWVFLKSPASQTPHSRRRWVACHRASCTIGTWNSDMTPNQVLAFLEIGSNSSEPRNHWKCTLVRSAMQTSTSTWICICDDQHDSKQGAPEMNEMNHPKKSAKSAGLKASNQSPWAHRDWGPYHSLMPLMTPGHLASASGRWSIQCGAKMSRGVYHSGEEVIICDYYTQNYMWLSRGLSIQLNV